MEKTMSEQTEMTWEAFVEQVQDLALQNGTGYTLYERKGIAGYMSDEEVTQKQGLPAQSRYMGCVHAPIEFEGEMTAFYEEPEGIHFHADRPTRLRGGQPNNRNRAKGRYNRIIISLSGPDYDRLVDAISQDGPATNADIEDAVYAAIRKVYS